MGFTRDGKQAHLLWNGRLLPVCRGHAGKDFRRSSSARMADSSDGHLAESTQPSGRRNSRKIWAFLAFDSLFRSVVEEKFDQAPPADRIPPSPAIGAKRARAHAAGMGPRTFSSFFGILTAATVTLVSLVAWVFSYGPMQVLASSGMRHGLAQIWPVVIFGPWLVACLSILRAAFDQRRIGLSWAVVVMFSSTAAALSIATVSHTPASVVVCGLPPITSVISFHQLVRQIGASMTPGPLQPPSRRGARHRADPAGRASA